MILPIHLLDTGDETLFGKEYVLLSRLGRLGFPIAAGFVVSSPLKEITEYVKDHQVVTLTDFETKEGLIYQYMLQKKPELHMLGIGEVTHFETHWPEIVKRWVKEIHSHYTRHEGFQPKHFKLNALPILFSTSVNGSGIVSWNHIIRQSQISLSGGELEMDQISLIDDLMIKAHQKLGMHYDYSFMIDNGRIVFTRLIEPNHQIPVSSEIKQVKKQFETTKSKAKRITKFFTTFSGSFVLDEIVDGYFLNSEQFSSHDQKLMVLLETMIAKHPQEILYQVSKKFFKSDAAVIKYCRNQKKYDNLHLVFDGDQSRESVLDLRRDLAVEGVSRKGKLKYWLSVSTPAAVMQVEESLSEGFDGVLIDIDVLAGALHARHASEVIEEQEIGGLISFLEPIVKQLQKKKIPLILRGQVVAMEQMVKTVLKWGIYGVIIDQETEIVHERFVFQEQVVQFGLG